MPLLQYLPGVLFISFNADYRVLYQPLTEKSVDDAMQYYRTFYSAPKAVLVSVLFFSNLLLTPSHLVLRSHRHMLIFLRVGRTFCIWSWQ